MSRCSTTNLRCDVVGSAAECFGLFVVEDALFAHAEIGNLDMALAIEQDIIQLQVPIDDSMAVKVKEADGYFSGVEPAATKHLSSRPVRLLEPARSMELTLRLAP